MGFLESFHYETTQNTGVAKQIDFVRLILIYCELYTLDDNKLINLIIGISAIHNRRTDHRNKPFWHCLEMGIIFCIELILCMAAKKIIDCIIVFWRVPQQLKYTNTNNNVHSAYGDTFHCWCLSLKVALLYFSPTMDSQNLDRGLELDTTSNHGLWQHYWVQSSFCHFLFSPEGCRSF